MPASSGLFGPSPVLLLPDTHKHAGLVTIHATPSTQAAEQLSWGAQERAARAEKAVLAATARATAAEAEVAELGPRLEMQQKELRKAAEQVGLG